MTKKKNGIAFGLWIALALGVIASAQTAEIIETEASIPIGEVVGSKSSFKMTVETTATREDIYTLWRNPAFWAQWDPQIASVEFNGPIEVGQKGKIKGTKGPTNKFKIREINPNTRFTYSVKAPLGKIVFDRYFEEGEPLRFTHSVEFRGAGGKALVGILSETFQEGLPGAMGGLKVMAEKPAVLLETKDVNLETKEQVDDGEAEN